MGADPYAVVDLDGRRLCRTCAERPATLGRRFCSPHCRAAWGTATIPTPAEIRRRRDAIRASWTRREEHFRRFGCLQLARLILGWQVPHATPAPMEGDE